MDPVQEQVDAFNARDLERFLSHYAPETVIEDGTGNVVMQGLETMGRLYGALFENSPNLHAEVVSRIRVGSYVVDEERTTGVELPGLPAEAHVVVIYRVQDEKIVHVRLLQ